MSFQVFIAPYSNPLNGQWTDAADAVATYEAAQDRFDEVAFMDAEHALVDEHSRPEFVEALAELDADEDRLLRAFVDAGGIDAGKLADEYDVAYAVGMAQERLACVSDTKADAWRAFMDSGEGEIVEHELSKLHETIRNYFNWEHWANEHLDHYHSHGEIDDPLGHGFLAARHYYFRDE